MELLYQAALIGLLPLACFILWVGVSFFCRSVGGAVASVYRWWFAQRAEAQTRQRQQMVDEIAEIKLQAIIEMDELSQRTLNSLREMYERTPPPRR